MSGNSAKKPAKVAKASDYGSRKDVSESEVDANGITILKQRDNVWDSCVVFTIHFIF
jgi:hypothetical protein